MHKAARFLPGPKTADFQNMPTVTKTGGKAGSNFVRPKAQTTKARTRTKARSTRSARASADGFELDLEPSRPITSLSEAVLLIYGEPKIGKTSLASQFPSPYFLFFEPGQKGISVRRSMITSWATFKKAVAALALTDEVETVIIDVSDKCYKRCYEYVMTREGIRHPNDKPFGEGWGYVEDEFIEVIDLLIASGKGIVFLAHVTEREFSTKSGRTYQKVIPDMSKQARGYIGGLADVIAYYGYYGNDRYLTIRGSDELDAGTRLKKFFKTPSGRKVHSIPMFDESDADFDEVGAYRNLVRAFNNKQRGTGEPEDFLFISERPVKKTKQR